MKTKYTVALLPGDGISPEIICESRKLFDCIGKLYGHKIKLIEALIGGAAIDAVGSPLPQETIEICQKSDAVLMAAVGGPKWDNLPIMQRPEKGLLDIRDSLKVYANLRHVRVFNELKHASSLLPNIIGDNLDIMIVRELCGDVYFGLPRGEETRNNERTAFNTMIYSESEIRKIARLAMKLAMKRSKKVCSVDKANVLEVSKLWRAVVIEVAKEFPEIELSHMYVDNAAMQLVRNPQQFDVIVTGNLFGDILSDEAAMLTGSIGMLPSAAMGDKAPFLYSPIHGSAPDIAGKDQANPLATILSIAMMYRYSFAQEDIANAIEKTVAKILADGWRTLDIMESNKQLIGCKHMGDLVIEYLQKTIN